MANRLVIQSTTDSAWASSTDLMSGLMIVFLFIAISYMQNVSNIAEEWVETKKEIYDSLYREFKDDLDKWDAEIIEDSLSIRFREPRVLFEIGEAKLKPRFKIILRDFFPRYLRVLESDFKDDISEIRIEGHTSSEWNDHVSKKMAFFYNLKLSQERSREVAKYSLSTDLGDKEYIWISEVILAAGLSSSRLIYENGNEEQIESRRVEFRVRTNAEEKLTQMIHE